MNHRTVCVTGIPTQFPQERIQDKLFIHFLRSRNGGGEIVDITFLPEDPSAALITFEKAEVAQQVLRTGTHTLSAFNKEYTLTAKPYYTEVKPDEIFLRVSMAINYGKLPDGKRTMKNLKKIFKDVHVSFDTKEQLCLVKGAYTDLQELSKEILHILDPEKRSRHTSEKEHTVNNTFHSRKDVEILRKSRSLTSPKEHDQLSDIELELKGTESLLNDSMETLTDEQEHDGSVEGTEGLIMDSDIYTYMLTFHKDKYQQILYSHRVEVVDVTNSGITTLFLQVDSECSGSGTALRKARQELQDLYQDLECTLRKEQLSKVDLAYDEHCTNDVTNNIKIIFPQVLLHEDEKYLYVIGSSKDVSQVKQVFFDLHIKADVSKFPARETSLHAVGSNVSNRSEDELRLDQQLKNNNSSPSSSIHKDTKLAAMLSASLSEIQTCRSKSIVSENDFLTPAKNSVTQSSIKKENQNNDCISQRQTELDFQVQPQTDNDVTGDMSSPLDLQINEDFRTFNKPNEDVVFKKLDMFSTGLKGIVSKSLQPLKTTRSPGPIKPYKINGFSDFIPHLDLKDGTQSFRAEDSNKVTAGFEHKNTIKRANSFSGVLKSEENKSVGFTQVVKTHTEELLLDAHVWLYLKFIYSDLIKSIYSKDGVETTEEQFKDVAVLKFRGQNKVTVSSAKMGILSLYLKEYKDLGFCRISYSQLNIESSADKILDKWCRDLQNSYEKVKIDKGIDCLEITGPNSQCWKVKDEITGLSKNRMYCMRQVETAAGISHNMELSEKYHVKEYTSSSSLTAFQEDQEHNLDKKLNTTEPVSHHTDILNAFHTQSSAEDIENGTSLKDINTKESSVISPGAELIEVSSAQKRATKNAQRNSTSQAPDELLTENVKQHVSRETYDASNNSAKNVHHFIAQNQKSVSGQESFSSENIIGKSDAKEQNWTAKQMSELNLPLSDKALPEQLFCLNNKKINDSTEEREGIRLRSSRIDSGPQSLPVCLTSTQYTHSVPRTTAARSALLSVLTSHDHMKLEEHSSMNNDVRLQDQQIQFKLRPRSPAVGEDAQDLQVSRCLNCRKQNFTSTEPICSSCTSASLLANSCDGIKGRMIATPLSFSLPGYGKDPALKITYEIPDGTQGANDPKPGASFTGGRFEAYLPFNKEGEMVYRLLKKAFEKGLIFKYWDDSVVLGNIPLKTSIDGGKSKNGYPDSSYLRNVCDALKNLGLE
ncbi:uncharacterized protein LOC122787763 isoform X2 [Protopterus annectens]|nr:uncharacterized protein LOC122787763 isoform X2 [Protopterus annectens]